MLWVGEILSRAGIQLGALALPLTALMAANATTVDLGIMRTLQALPYLLFGLPFGELTRRVAIKSILVTANFIRFALVASIPLVAQFYTIDVNFLFAVAFGIGVTTVAFDTGWTKLIDAATKNGSMTEFIPKFNATSATGSAVGYIAGGALISALTAPIAMAANAFTFLASVISIAIGTNRELRNDVDESRHGALTQGVRWILRDRDLRILTLGGNAENFCICAIQVVLIPYLLQDKHLTPWVIGIVYAAGAAGAILGAALGMRLRRWLSGGTSYHVADIICAIGCLLIPLAPGSGATTVAVLALGDFVTYSGMMATNVIGTAVRQTTCPKEFIGQAIIAHRTVGSVTIALGSFLGGWAAASLGIKEMLWIAAAGMCAAAGSVAISGIRSLGVAGRDASAN